MSDDEGEKFFLNYWRFEDAPGLGNASGIILPGGINDAFAASDDTLFRPAFLLHTDEQVEIPQLMRRLYSGAVRREVAGLAKREFRCPSGMSSCGSIGRSDACCGEGDTCQEVEDAQGQSLVGCCPAGKSCSDGIGACPEGYGSCPSSLGGGCCIPGYECVEGGCVSISTVTRSITTSQETSTSRSPTPTTSSESSSQTETTTRTTTSSQEQSPPMRPTTDVESTVTATETITGPDMCPTGFYACSAVYQGGCCRTGRDCDTTSCPPTSSVTVVDSNGVTVAVPTGDAATTSNPCATGWFSCAASDGGGCCPSGFACGRESCTASGSGTATSTVAKMEQDAATHMRVYPLSLTLVLITVMYLL
ncbi:hypothetical protein VTN31DRAFT_3341 [Thermomyces dupontii]|uniref:uncharacterized protein n=1 Tax=Talaromyces thermophilus TaxID=28565 RepID=UPI003743179F